MRRLGALVCAAFLVLTSAAPALAAPVAELYSVNVTRLLSNVYRDRSSGALVLTHLCLELAIGRDAVLDYTRYSYNNRLVFPDTSTSCSVTLVSLPNATLKRVAQDLYLDLNTQTYVQTRFCYTFAFGEPALVLQDRVIFVDSREQCDLP
jgi:hypothetical protein